MQLPIMITTSAIFVAALIGILVNFRFLTYPLIPSLNPTAHAEKLQLKGNTLFISDLHLRANRAFNQGRDLRNFIETNNVSNLIIDGDLFDSPRDAQQILSSNNGILKVLDLEGLIVNLFWVIGSPHHDPANSKELTRSMSLRILDRCALIQFDRFEVLAYHGHDMSHVGALGHAWDGFVFKLGLEKAWKRVAKVDRNVWVIFGHTHIPGVDVGNRVANCGGWQRVPFVLPSRTGILVSEMAEAPKLVQLAS